MYQINKKAILILLSVTLLFCSSENKKENPGVINGKVSPDSVQTEDKKELSEFEKQIRDQEGLFKQNREFEKYINAKCIRSSADCIQRCRNIGLYNFVTLFSQILGGKYLINKSDHSTAYNSTSCQEFCESNNKELWSLCDTQKNNPTPSR